MNGSLPHSPVAERIIMLRHQAQNAAKAHSEDSLITHEIIHLLKYPRRVKISMHGAFLFTEAVEQKLQP